MDRHIVITIGRETGSGGRQIGMTLAGKLGVKCYDKELISVAAKESGLCEEIFEAYDEKPTNSFLYSLATDVHSGNFASASSLMNNLPLNHKVFLAQFEAIKNLAKRESCVIVGRCADYALADCPDMVSAFVWADPQIRIKTIMDRFNQSYEQSKAQINKTDKKRASYYNFYSGKKWGDARSYDLCLNSGTVGYEACADLIVDFIEKRR